MATGAASPGLLGLAETLKSPIILFPLNYAVACGTHKHSSHVTQY